MHHSRKLALLEMERYEGTLAPCLGSTCHWIRLGFLCQWAGMAKFFFWKPWRHYLSMWMSFFCFLCESRSFFAISSILPWNTVHTPCGFPVDHQVKLAVRAEKQCVAVLVCALYGETLLLFSRDVMCKAEADSPCGLTVRTNHLPRDRETWSCVWGHCGAMTCY